MKKVITEIFDKLIENDIDEININHDYYWLIDSSSFLKIYDKVEPVMGQLSEDLEYLTKYQNNEDIPISFLLGKVAHVLKYISINDKLVLC